MTTNSCNSCDMWLGNTPGTMWNKTEDGKCFPNQWTQNGYKDFASCSAGAPDVNYGVRLPPKFDCASYPVDPKCLQCSNCSREEYNPGYCCGTQPYLNVSKTWGIQKPFTL